MIFQLPPKLADESIRQELQRSSVTGGQDNMPYPTDASIECQRLMLARSVSESGSLQTPWRIPGFGQLMTSSATLMERPAPYQLILELARGKVNQLRSQTADWIASGLAVSDALSQRICAATHAFGQAVLRVPDAEAGVLAEEALKLAFEAAHDLVQTYVAQVFALRHHRQQKLDTALSCRLEGDTPSPAATASFLSAFNSAAIPFSWQQIEPSKGCFDWHTTDRMVQWALAQGLRVIGGPLIDFAGRDLPDWLWEDTANLTVMSQHIAAYVEQAVQRYYPRVRAWQITAGSNCAGVVARRDEELIWLTWKAVEAARQLDPSLELIVGLAQPWGDYLAEQERSKTPFVFADDLLRTGIKLAALDLEFIMGISPRGSYCRDLLETTRVLELYMLLGVPIQVTLGYPSSAAATEMADPEQRINLGCWRGGCTEAAQADWAAAFASLALCKPHVRTVQWSHWSDAQPHTYPNCGLIDAEDRAKAALQVLTKLRAEHLP